MTARAPRSYHFWTRSELLRLREAKEQGYPYPIIAHKLGRSVSAVREQLDRQGMLDITPVTYSTCDISRIFGLCSTHTVYRWIRRGYLRRRHRRISEETVLAFIENVETWPAWEVERITDPDLREYAREVRANGPRWLRTTEASRILGVEHESVRRYIISGDLPAVRWRHYYVREDVCVRFKQERAR